MFSYFFFFNDTATTEIYTLSLHDALPISPKRSSLGNSPALVVVSQVHMSGCTVIHSSSIFLPSVESELGRSSSSSVQILSASLISDVSISFS